MSIEQNKQLVLRWREALNSGDLNAIDELFAPDYVGHLRGYPWTDPRPRGTQGIFR